MSMRDSRCLRAFANVSRGVSSVASRAPSANVVSRVPSTPSLRLRMPSRLSSSSCLRSLPSSCSVSQLFCRTRVRAVSTLSKNSQCLRAPRSNFHHGAPPLKFSCLDSLAPSQRVFSRNFTLSTAESDMAKTAQAVKDAKKNMVIVYGSQTGTAMNFAHEMVKEARKRGYNARVIDPSHYYHANVYDDGILVMIMANFGKGEPTDNSRTFYDWAMSPARESPEEKAKLSHIPFAVFGLGQSKTYPDRYQAVGKAIDRRFQSLGSLRMMERGEGDDNGDIEDDFEKWLQSFWQRMDQLHKFDPSSAPTAAAAPAPPKPSSPPPPPPSPSAAPVCPADKAPPRPPPVADNGPLVFGQHSRLPLPAPGQVPDVNRPFEAPLVAKRELNGATSTRSTIHLEVDLKGSAATYTTGDYIGVLPVNDMEMVKSLADRMGMDLNESLDASKHAVLERMRQPSCSVGVAMLHFFDITSPPRRNVLRALAEYADSPKERDKLTLLSSRTPVGAADYNTWVVNRKLTLLEVIHAFPSIKHRVDANEFCGLLNGLQPRFYSISSSSHLSPSQAHITCSVVDFKSPTGRRHRGVCSSFLNRLRVGERVPVFIKQSLFRLPDDPSTPVIMIGAGSGVAPFRAFTQERLAKQKGLASPGENVLFFGIGRRQDDYLYGNEFDAASKSGLDLQLACGFENSWNEFVQHRMLEPSNSAKIWQLLEKGAYLYVCGDAKNMAPAVQEALVQIVQSEGMMDRESAVKYLADKQAHNTYQLDVFA